MKKLSKVVALSLTAALAASVLGACGSSDKKTETAAAESAAETEAAQAAEGVSLEDNTLVAGTNAEFPPFEYVAGQGVIDEFDGIDMAIIKQIADDNGWNVKINNMEFDSLSVALKNGQINCAIAGMTITDERKEEITFSDPYYTATQVMIVPEDSTIASAKDMEGKKISVIQGYTGETVVQELGYQYDSFKKGADAVLELVNGKCDVLVIDSATAEQYVKENKGLKIVEDPEAFANEQYGIAVQKGDDALLNAINASLKKMQEDGTMDKIIAEYMDKTE